MGLFDFGFIPLKAGVLVQDSLARISNAFTISGLLIMRLSGIGWTQIAYALGVRVDDD